MEEEEHTKSDFVPGGFNNRTFFIRLRNWISNINPVTEYFFERIHKKDQLGKFLKLSWAMIFFTFYLSETITNVVQDLFSI